MLDHAATRPEVEEVVEVSLGDYVLNGGEVAAIAVTEAVVRLLPGFMGNASSLVEESHEDGLLEYPVYTKPASWRGHEVPPVLLSGDHGRIAAWRREQSLERTAARRPDLLPPYAVGGEWAIVPATRADAAELLTLQRACWVQEAIANDDVAGIPALHESLDDVVAWLGTWTTYVVRVPSDGGRLVGAVRGRLEGDAWDIGRIMVAPDLQGRGLGRLLLEHVQQVAPPAATSYVLFTGARSTDNIRMYKKAGFRLRPDLPAPPLAVVLTKPRRIGSRSYAVADSTVGPTGRRSAPIRHRPRRRPPGGTASGACHRGRLTPPATTVGPTCTTTPEHPSVPRLTCGTREETHMTNIIAELGNAQKRTDVPAFRAGDTVKVHVKVVEGNRSRVQIFQGVVIRIHGAGIGRTFTVRKVSFGVGVERTFPLNSPIFEEIEIVTRGDVRRAKLYYLRNLRGKAAKIKERREF